MEEGRRGWGEYRESKRKYGRMCVEKKKEELERWEKELEGVRTEGQVWKVLKRERKRRRRVNEGIKMEIWEEHFKGLLGGVEWRVKRGEEGRGGRMGRWRLEGRKYEG